MTRDSWREVVLHAARCHEQGDDVLLDLMSSLLAEQDEAKARLQRLGIACCGQPWKDVVDTIEECYL